MDTCSDGITHCTSCPEGLETASGRSLKCSDSALSLRLSPTGDGGGTYCHVTGSQSADSGFQDLELTTPESSCVDLMSHETSSVVPMSHETSSAVPMSHETSSDVPTAHDMPSGSPMAHETSSVVPMAHEASVIPTAHETSSVVPSAHATLSVAPTADEALVVPTAHDTSSVVPTAYDTSLVAPMAHAILVAPTVSDISSVTPTARDTSLVAPTARDTSSVAPTARDASSVAPTARDTSSVVPTARDTSSVVPTARDASSVAPTARDASSVAPTARDASSVAPTARDTSSVAPTTRDTSSVAPTTRDTSSVAPTARETSSVAPMALETSFDVLATDGASLVEVMSRESAVDATTLETISVDLTASEASMDFSDDGSVLGMLFRRSTLREPAIGSMDNGQAVAKAVSRSTSRVSRSVQFAVPDVPDVTDIPEAEPRVTASDATVAPPQPVADEATQPVPPTPVTPPSPPVVSTGGHHRETEEERGIRVGGFWPHAPSSLFATLTCTVGMFDICRFSYLSFQYGGGFILQFLMLTVVFGLPMLSFQMTVGQYLGAGIMDMWKVSPIFYGVGISSVISMALYGVYNVIPVSWMFVYFRDSFVTNLTFKWGECRNVYRPEECLKYPLINASDILEKAIPSYYQNRVLQRQSFGNNTANSNDLVFENVFNLAVIWMVVFICLSKGIKSYGKVVLAFGIFPMLSFYLLSIELLRRASSGAELIMSLNTDMSTFFLNGWSWLAAAREVFFIWGMNGAAIMQIASHNKHRHNLKRDCAIVIVITLSIILLSAFLACACLFIIYKGDRFQHRFVPSSFENMNSARFLIPNQNVNELNINMADFVSTNYLVGVESVAYNGDTSTTSGHQVARFATELYPTAMVVLTPTRVSAFWPVLFYLCLITFGIAQQLAIWKCVVEGVIAIYPEKLRSWETSITFLACVFGFVLGLPFVTQVGVQVVHFMDVCIGSAWWIMLIYLVQVFALLLIRGRPYTSDDIVVVLTNSPAMKRWLAPVISFSWNVVLPITFLVLSITSFKLGDFGRLFFWDSGDSYVFWPLWAKQIGAFIQILPIVVIPSVSLIQIMRYMSYNMGGFMQRFESLVRPAPTLLPCIPDSLASLQTPPTQEAEVTSTQDDPPPKYTPPPSYNTATGMKLLKRLNSLRMSFRRSQRSQRPTVTNDVEMQEPSGGATEPEAAVTTTTTTTTAAEVTRDIPPSYSAILQPTT